MQKIIKFLSWLLFLVIILCAFFHKDNIKKAPLALNKEENKSHKIQKTAPIKTVKQNEHKAAIQNKDSDNDGLSDALEAKLNSDPFNSDTDSDGKKDGVEGQKDSDGDGFLDLLESVKKDSDNDGVVDELDKENDNAHNDNDGDGYSNIQEKVAHTNPLDPKSFPIIKDMDKDSIPDSKDNDIDGDGLSNKLEALLHSNPKNKDSDNDGKLDGIEGKKDSDNDGKLDILESAKIDSDNDGVVDELDSDDNNQSNDSDNDGYTNIEEKNAQTNPLDPNEHPKIITKKVKEKIEQEISKLLANKNIQFESNSAKLTQESLATIKEIAKILKQYPSAKIKIAGYTDSSGSDEHNLKLSQERVKSVKNELVRLGIDANRLKAVGYGEANPIAPNDTKANKAKNRRVEFIVIIGEKDE